MSPRKAERDEDNIPTPPVDPIKAAVSKWATEAGMLPEFSPGGKVRPVIVNQETWKYKAAMLRMGWTAETEITQEEFNRVVEDVSNFLVR
jgi:hypothetical protein